MIRKYKSEWVLPVLADLAVFFDENDMTESLTAILAAAKVAKSELGGAATYRAEATLGSRMSLRIVNSPDHSGNAPLSNFARLFPRRSATVANMKAGLTEP